MKKLFVSAALAAFAAGSFAQGPVVKTQAGDLEGVVESGITVFKGIPFAAPPVGGNRWRAPQPVQPWQGVRKADKFGDDPMQGHPFGDMGFSADKKSEDCLYLNVWTPVNLSAPNSQLSAKDLLPVLIYFNGGGLFAGSGSEPRYAGQQLARRGIVSITANYREGIFGFFTHPELSKETDYKGSGNYGFMDQAAAIKWVYDNIAAFGGDPNKITIVGESAGSMSVSALLVSPLSKPYINKAMASSGSVCAGHFPTLKEAEAKGVAKLKEMGVKNIKEARKMSAEELLEKSNINSVPSYCVDGYVFTEDPEKSYKEGHQAKIPLLVGRNSAEGDPHSLFGDKAPTKENLRPLMVKLFGDKADEAFKAYGINEDKDVLGKPGFDLASDLFIAYSTWYFGYLHNQTSGQPVYRYYYAHPRPEMRMQGVKAALAGGIEKVDEIEKVDKVDKEFNGAVHSADIEYAMGTLPTNRVFDWQPEDFQVSDQFIGYYANFIKTGNPNGLGLSDWQPLDKSENPPMLILDVNSHEVHDAAFEARNKFYMKYRRTLP